jgi:hypothetical protein
MKITEKFWSWSVVVLVGAAVVGPYSGTRLLASPVVITETNDFSDSVASPTDLTSALGLGTNVIQGAADGNAWGTDQDYFRVSLPANSRLTEVRLIVRNWVNPSASSGFFEILPTEEGNTANYLILDNMNESMAFTVGNPTNIIFHLTAAFAVQLGSQTSYDYELVLLVEEDDSPGPVTELRPIDGVGIHTAVEVTIPSEAGREYQLQCTSDLNSDSWTNLGDPMVGTGEVMSAFDSTRNAGQCFYRVVTEQEL